MIDYKAMFQWYFTRPFSHDAQDPFHITHKTFSHDTQDPFHITHKTFSHDTQDPFSWCITRPFLMIHKIPFPWHFTRHFSHDTSWDTFPMILHKTLFSWYFTRHFSHDTSQIVHPKTFFPREITRPFYNILPIPLPLIPHDTENYFTIGKLVIHMIRTKIKLHLTFQRLQSYENGPKCFTFTYTLGGGGWGQTY